MIPNRKFTGKERDAETGLDYFGARYMSSAQGRFTSPDPLLNSGHPADPQSWNRYTYALNNPLKITDPTGLYNVDCGDDKKCQKYADRLRKGIERLTKAVGKMKDGDAKTRLEHSLNAMGTENDGNNVNVKFGALAGTAAAQTDPTFGSKTNEYSSFTVTFDMAKNGNGDETGMAMNAATKGHMWAISKTHLGVRKIRRRQWICFNANTGATRLPYTPHRRSGTPRVLLSTALHCGTVAGLR